MALDLALVWAAVIGFAVVMYVVMDGFDLGIGILFPLAADERARDQMMATIKPFWDGNETWLVMGGAGLLVAFPAAYAILMPAMYIPVIVMLLGLIFRGVAFEFRSISRTKAQWNFAFAAGSAVAALSQGVILGGLVQGIPVENRAFAGHAFDWATPFAFVCALGVASGYALLGATWLIMKAEGPVARRAHDQAKVALLLVLAFMGLVSLWTPFAIPQIAERWFSLPNFLFLWPVPVVTGALAFLAWRWIDREHDASPFLAAIGMFLLGYLGLVISWFPYLVPPQLTIWDTAAAPGSQMFMLVGTLILLPIILGYTVLVYWLFRGKVREGEGYH
jgi:cytochrome d ubiquinol oxidase subunit II